MSSSKNIGKAFAVVRQTYENIYKLLSYLQDESAKSADYELMTPLPRFLRYKSDKDYSAWLINDFILLFQHKHDAMLENNGWRDGAVYGFEINLYPTEPTVVLCKYDFNDIAGWDKGYAVSEWWFWHNVVYGEGAVEFSVDSDTEFSGKAMGDGTLNWGLKSITGVSFPLTDITAATATDLIFCGFDKLRNNEVTNG
jgi:hypothetical protein